MIDCLWMFVISQWWLETKLSVVSFQRAPPPQTGSQADAAVCFLRSTSGNCRSVVPSMYVALSPVQLGFSSSPSCFSTPGDSSGVSKVPSESELWKQQKTFTKGVKKADCWDGSLCSRASTRHRLHPKQSERRNTRESFRQEETSCFYFRGRERRGSRHYKATCILWPSVKTHTHTHKHTHRAKYTHTWNT